MEGSHKTIEALRHARAAIAHADLSGHDAQSLQTLLAELRLTERSLTSLTIKAGQRSDSLAADGKAPDAEEAFLASGAVSGSTARKERDRSRIANAIPKLGTALDQGTIGGEHLDAVASAARRLDPDVRPLFDACAGDLVDRSDNTPVDTFRRQVQRLAERVVNDHGLEVAREQRAATSISMWQDKSGMGHLRGDFDPESFAALQTSIARQVAAMASAAASTDEPVTKGKHLDALALLELVRGSNAAAGRADVTVVVDGDTFTNGPHDHSVRETVDGTRLAYETVRRLCCDAIIRKVVLDHDGRPLDVGRQFRTATKRQWAAMRSIHSTCAWRTCDRPISWCQAHHITEWEHGGRTDLDNLVPLCSRHHHAVHEGGWSIKLLPDRTLRIFTPGGEAQGSAHPDRLTRDHVGMPPPGSREPCHN